LERHDVVSLLTAYQRLESALRNRNRFDTAALRRSESLSRKMLASLGEIGQQLTSTRDLDELLDRVLDLAIENVRAERGMVFLRAAADGEMHVANARGVGSTDLEDLTTFSRSVVRRAAEGQTIHTMDVGQDPGLSSVQSIVIHEIKSILCVPMKSRGEVLGVIYLDTRKKTQLFTEKERTFVESFAGQAAIAIENARVFGRMKEENSRLRREAESRFPELVGTSSLMRQLHKIIAGVLDVDCTLLITGESGTGKGVIARTIHAHGSRRDGPFLTVDCGALPENLLEGELFGYKRGAFTGAERDRVGLLEEANGGVLFLDEIANTSIGLQARLLRVLQEREVRRLGENQARRVNVRVIAATNADLPSLIVQGRFRQDLFYRLNVIPVVAPPLRDRQEDVPLLVAAFLKRHARDGNPTRMLGPGVLEMLQRHAWPGNVRELENLMERLVVLCRGEVITVADLPDSLHLGEARTFSRASEGDDSESEVFRDGARKKGVDFDRESRARGTTRKTGEQIMIEDALHRFRGDKTKAAKFIGWNRQKLYRRIKSYSIPADFGKAA
jgi:Nif-specific regulatory protein